MRPGAVPGIPIAGLATGEARSGPLACRLEMVGFITINGLVFYHRWLVVDDLGGSLEKHPDVVRENSERISQV